jgi:hypothetical protein
MTKQVKKKKARAMQSLLSSLCSIKTVVLVALCLQNASHALLGRYVQVRKECERIT